MFVSKTLTITDDTNFLALVNADKYKSFLNADWEYRQLLIHFIEQMNANNLIIWETGFENEWAILFSNEPSSRASHREFSKQIEVTDGYLYLTNYEDLTMAAQFEDEAIPTKQNEELYVEINNGIYNLTVRQMFNPNQHKMVGVADFEIIIEKQEEIKSTAMDRVFWLNE